ncbi:MAG: NrdH-redoxin [Ilumatobacteraceae bacterium]|nr:NrdH-redoxin [Ilumatobacteraceae bacterium]
MPATAPRETNLQINFYWRPGCGFCAMLRRKLDKLGIERVEHNIWDEPESASVVRNYANGNETVPTVVIGDTGFVNPSAKELVSYLTEHQPQLLPADFESPQPSVAARVANRVLGN